MAFLEIQSVSKRFGGLMAINNVSLEIEQGEIVGLIGPNGAGKTTLFNLISGMHRADRGKIFFNKVNITRLRPHLCCRLGIGRTFQIVQTFTNRTVLFNVTVGALAATKSIKAAREDAREVLSFVGLQGKEQLMVSNLTIGDRKRLEVAKALATRPKILLLDEVMAGLNPRETEQAIELIREIKKRGMTIFLIEHVMQVVMNLSERVAILHYGEKIAEGSPEQISRDPSVIEAYLGQEYVFGEEA